MAQNLLASLTLAGIIERTGPGRRTLRVTPRFMAHAEGTVGRLHTLGLVCDDVDVLHAALQTWDDFLQDPWSSARFLHQIMADRDQLGQLRPVFPAIEQFSAAA